MAQQGDLSDLLTLDTGTEGTETGDIFHEVDSEIVPEVKPPKKRQRCGASDSRAAASNYQLVDGNSRSARASQPPTKKRRTSRTAKAVVKLQEGDDDRKPASSDDNDILTSLFQKTGVHTAFSHDKIMKADSHVADNVAKKAASKHPFKPFVAT